MTAHIELVPELPAIHRSGRGRPPWGAEEAKELMAHPGQIAIIDRGPRGRTEGRRLASRAQIINESRTDVWNTPGGHFEAWVRTVPGASEVRLYARFTPGAPAQADEAA